MDEHRFVIALTFEQLDSRRARHLRAMVILERCCSRCRKSCRRDYEEHKTRYRTLLAIAREYGRIPSASRRQSLATKEHQCARAKSAAAVPNIALGALR